MKIVKYLFLLVILFTITVSVFVATKDGNYAIQHKQIIDVSKDIAYKYISNEKNWDSINPWKDDNYIVKKTTTIPNESIIQDVVINDVENQLKLEFNDTLKNKTIVTWSTTGKLSFKDKLYSMIGKGAKNDFKDRFETVLTYANKTLTRELNTYSIALDGFLKRDTIFYIQKPLVSKKEQISSYIKKYLPQLEKILTSTNTPSNGSPFIIYHSKDSVANKFKYSIAIPVHHKIYTSIDSDIITGQINPSSTIKATLKGNYLHLNKAVQKILYFMNENQLMRSYKFKEIEVIRKNSTTEKSASNWITEIYYPVKPLSSSPSPITKPTMVDSNTVIATEKTTKILKPITVTTKGAKEDQTVSKIKSVDKAAVTSNPVKENKTKKTEKPVQKEKQKSSKKEKTIKKDTIKTLYIQDYLKKPKGV